MEDEFTESHISFGGLSDDTACELWQKLRPLLRRKVKHTYGVEGPSAMIPDIASAVSFPVSNDASGIAPQISAQLFENQTENYTCIPLGSFDLKCRRTIIYMDAIKMSGGWQLYFIAQAIPNHLPKKKRPAALAEISQILGCNDVFQEEMLD